MADVFVYGTLKRGQPNHKVLLDATNGSATFRSRGRTVEPYPLVIAGERNIPRLLNLPGRGYRGFGEIYAVDEQMLRVLDEFEECPDLYQRVRVSVEVLEGEGASKEPPAAERCLQCFVYIATIYPPEWAQLPYLENYDSQGAHGLPHHPRKTDKSPRKAP
ncbi:gamma-glutamylaminecyclotransferase isoform X2 [Myotis daubentonii]|nr:gamma-glutamylaminecyclotransferase isoform X2 [Myotis daubentonii]XP_059541027.1 gamma-glutamylaminecyclotransferase isoform X2 [Myotis daubentonii]XP_059541028.1 gamma-glutamylaminecyclotransferase isoform X2 [Myotis daubentonii]